MIMVVAVVVMVVLVSYVNMPSKSVKDFDTECNVIVWLFDADIYKVG